MFTVTKPRTVTARFPQKNFQQSRVFLGDRPLTKRPEDSGYEIPLQDREERELKLPSFFAQALDSLKWCLLVPRARKVFQMLFKAFDQSILQEESMKSLYVVNVTLLQNSPQAVGGQSTASLDLKRS